MTVLNVGIIQMGTRKLDLAYNFAKSCRLIRAAARKGAHVVVTPECMLDGYSFDHPVFQAHPEQYAIAIDDDRVRQYCDIARECACALVIGVSLQEYIDGSLQYRNAALFIDQTGRLQGTFVKAHSTYDDAEFHFYRHGEDYPIFHCQVGEEDVPVGIMICYDRQLPEPARILRVKGALVIFNPSATMNFATRWNTRLLQVRAYENGCYVVSVNHAFPRLCGFSLVADPRGRVVKRLVPWQTVKVIKLNLNAVTDRQQAMLTRRPSTYKDLLHQFGE